jgi:protein phosphatase 2C family protein 2/3
MDMDRSKSFNNRARIMLEGMPGSDDSESAEHAKGFSSNSRGRIILLGDGSEILTSSGDTEMLQDDDEDKDLASQVQKGEPAKPTAIPEKLETPPKIEYKAGTGEDSKAATTKKDESKID